MVDGRLEIPIKVQVNNSNNPDFSLKKKSRLLPGFSSILFSKLLITCSFSCGIAIHYIIDFWNCF